MRAHHRAGRRLAHEIGELTRAVTGPTDARELARAVTQDLESRSHATTRDVVAAVADRCCDDGQRSGLAAYLHLCRDFSFETLADVFGVNAATARRLVERGTGAVPVTAADGCRGWALVAPRAGRTQSELRAASGHLSLCRRCRYRLRAHAALEHRVAAVGSAAFGASVTAAIGRAVAGGHVGSAAAGAITGPVVALSTAAALTAGVGAFAVTSHGGGASHRVVTNDVRGRDSHPAHVDTRPVPSTEKPRRRNLGPATPPTAAPTPSGGLLPRRLVPIPGTTNLPLPQVSPPPLPLPTIRVSPPVIPTPSLPVPVPSLSLPPLP
jgi:hypothetical protein